MAYARIYPLIEALREKAEDIDGGDLTSKFQEIEEKWRKEFFNQKGTTAGFNIAKVAWIIYATLNAIEYLLWTTPGNARKALC